MAVVAMILGGVAGLILAIVSLTLGASWSGGFMVWSLGGMFIGFAILSGARIRRFSQDGQMAAEHA